MPARAQSVITAIGSAKQASITATSATFNRFLKLNSDVPFLHYGTEVDASEVGKSDEFTSAAGVFPTAYDHSGRFEKFGSSEFVLWAWGYALGVVGYSTPLYTITPLVPDTTLELPYFSVASKLTEGGSSAFDELYLGCAVESVETSYHYGPGRASLRTVVDYIGSGKNTIPSGITYPTSVLTERYMLSSSMAITVNGVDYVSNKGVLMGTMGWKNNILADLGYFPGSGVQDSAAVRGRLLIGQRVPTCSFTVFLTKDSLEYTKLLAQTTGTAVFTFTYDSTHTVTFTWQSVSFSAVERTTESGLVAVTVTIQPKNHATNGLLTVTGKCGITDIAQ